MTPDERNQFMLMQKDIEHISNKVDELLIALKGSDLSKDGGLIGRIQQLEEENDLLRKEVELIKSSNTKTEMYVKIIWTLVGAFGSGIFMYVLNLIFKK